MILWLTSLILERWNYFKIWMEGDRVTTVKLDPKFKYEISNVPGGQNIKRCFQCGTCSAGCQVGEVDERYNPRRIIRMALLGMRERVLSSDFIWLCSSCFTCQERCPQDVRVTELIRAITSLAAKKGHIHPAMAKQVKAVGTSGRLHKVSDFANKRRSDLGLPPARLEFSEIQEIFKLTGLAELVSPEGSD